MGIRRNWWCCVHIESAMRDGHSTSVLKCWNKVLQRLWNPHFWRFSKLAWTGPWATWCNAEASPVFSRELVLPEAPLNPHCSVMLYIMQPVLGSASGRVVSHLLSLRSAPMPEVWFFHRASLLFEMLHSRLISPALPEWRQAGRQLVVGMERLEEVEYNCLDWLKVPSGVRLG